jgi:diguanylate cyclase (GGDEF)-like protein
MNQQQKTSQSLRVVLIDGKGLDACLLAERLRRQSAGAVSVTCRTSLEHGLNTLDEQQHDLVLLDPSIARSGRVQAVKAVVAAALPAPVIVLAARHDPGMAGRCFQLGVQDYVAKSELDQLDLERVLQHAVERQRVVSELDAALQRAEHSATHDALTGLPGRTLFLDRAQQALVAAQRNGGSFGILFIDLDGFKEVNDTLGHEAGDRMLVGVAERLRAGVRASDTIARFGGDEFVVLADQLADPNDVEKIAAALEAQLERPIRIGRYKKRARISVGVATYPNEGTDVDTLLREADQAMYRAKRARRRPQRVAARVPARGRNLDNDRQVKAPSLFAQPCEA